MAQSGFNTKRKIYIAQDNHLVTVSGFLSHVPYEAFATLFFQHEIIQNR